MNAAQMQRLEDGLAAMPFDEIEDIFARRGIAFVTRRTAEIVERVEVGEYVSLEDIEGALYDYHSGPITKYFPPPEDDEC